MMTEKTFTRLLKCIDPRFFIVFNQELRYYEVKADMAFSRKVEVPTKADPDRILKIAIKNPTVAVLYELNDHALEELRFRRRKGEQPYRGSDADVRELIGRNIEASKKKKERSAEMIAEGFMKMDKMEKSKMFDLGGAHA